MQFFKKDTPDNNTASSHEAAHPESPQTMEQIARQWWSKHLGGTIPKDIENWLHDLTHTEARRLNMASALLTPKQEQQEQEAIRLGEAKLKHISETLQRIRMQQEWLHNYKRMSRAQKMHAAQLYEVNKRLTSDIHDEKRLERFEAFEAIQGEFQHIRLLRQMNVTNRTSQASISQQIEQASELAQEQSRLMEQLHTSFIETEKQMRVANEQFAQLCRIQGAGAVLDLSTRTTHADIESLQGRLDVMKLRNSELELSITNKDKRIAQLSQQLQTLEPHRHMLEKGRRVTLRLNVMAEIKEEIKQASAQLNETLQKQRDENSLLSQVFLEYQRVASDIKRIKDELQQHRASIAGTTSQGIQERTISETTRHQMLLSAQATWKLIQDGYEQIEETNRKITELSHKIKHGADTLSKLGKDVEQLERNYRDKEYTLTMSKSQSVIQLRSDLKEGISCTVCGAAHHPYHSDTMLEQNKLINELRTEYQLLQQEYNNKARLLAQLEQEQTVSQTTHAQQQDFLAYLRQQQDVLAGQWRMYAHLDRSFADCSPSTNHEARTEMLRLLVENAQRRANEAQQELNNYNFHQEEINRLNQQLAAKDQERANLETQLSEVNTGCHVLARQVEQFETMCDNAQKRFLHHYEEAEKNITLHEWLHEWQDNPETLVQRIANMQTQWNMLRQELEEANQERKLLDTILQANAEEETFLDSVMQQMQQTSEQYAQMRSTDQREYDLIMEKGKGGNFHQICYQVLLQGHNELIAQGEELQKRMERLTLLQGRQTELQTNGKQIDEQITQLRYNLDLWFRRYNATHPPVQYEELEATFEANTNWEEIRKRIRAAQVEAAMEQEMVKLLDAEIMDMQARASRSSTSIHELTDEALKEKLNTTEQEYFQEALLTARHHIRLQRDKEMRESIAQEQQALEALNK